MQTPESPFEDEARIAEANRRLKACVSPGFGIIPRLSFNLENGAATAREVLGINDPADIAEFVWRQYENVCNVVRDLKPGDCLITQADADSFVFCPALQAFVCTDHAGHYVGGASVVFAANKEEARALLDAQLAAHNLATSAEMQYTLRMLPLTPGAHILKDGDY